MGGRNQEFALSAATQIAGYERIVIGSVDTDGTDGPGKQFVDGTTVPRAEELGLDMFGELGRHNTSPVLFALDDGVVASPSVSMNDISVVLIQP